MKLYQLRRAIRLHGRFDGDGAAKQWGELIDSTARHIYQSWAPLQSFPIQSMLWENDGFRKYYREFKPQPVRTLYVHDGPARFEYDELVVTPERIDYGDGKDRFVRVVFGVQDWQFFIWELGGL